MLSPAIRFLLPLIASLLVAGIGALVTAALLQRRRTRPRPWYAIDYGEVDANTDEMRRRMFGQ